MELDFGEMLTPMAPSKEEAFAGIMLLATCCDGEFSDEESDGLDALLLRMRLYRDMSIDQIQNYVSRAISTIRKSGFDGALKSFTKALPEPLHRPAFANACDLVLADGVVEASEKEFINNLRRNLHVSPEDAQQIANVMVMKNKC